MGRYDKIRVFNGSSWVQPNNMYAHNGSSWVHYGDNNSYNTNSSYAFNGTSWVRQTLNRSDWVTYLTPDEKFVENRTFTTALSMTSSTITCSTRRHVGSSWSTYLCYLFSNVDSEWWAGTTLSNDGTEDWHQYEWSGGKWVYAMAYKSSNSSFFNAAPRSVLASFRNANGTWTSESTYTHTGWTASNQWGAYWYFNAKATAGYTAVKLRYFNNSTYKVATQSTRFGRFSLHTGDISTGTSWV